MKKIILLIVSLPIWWALAGCISQAPRPVGASTNSPPVYVASPAIASAVESVQGVLASTAPVNPYAAPLGALAGIVGAGITLVSTLIARRKTEQAHTQTAAADSLAEAVAKAGLNVKALQIAGINGTSAAVAVHLDNNALTPP